VFDGKILLTDTAEDDGLKWATMSGDATIAVSGALTIAAGAVTLAKMANLAANRIIGNNTGSAATPIALTATQVTAMLNQFTTSAQGLVPAASGGLDATYFLNATGAWSVPAGTGGSGTVTSANQYSIPYYSVSPSGTTVIGLAPQTTNGVYFLRANVTASAAVAPDWLGSTGSGNVVLATSPTLTTPDIGAATATSINKVAITAPATSATLTIADGSTLATSGAFSTTLTATGATTLTLPTTGTLATLSGTETFANKTLNGPKIGTAAGSGHFHLHFANSAPTGLADYITVFGDTSPNKKLGFLFELDAFESYFQFDATAASKTYTFPDLSGTVALLANAAAFTSVTVGTASSLAGDVIFQNATNTTTQTFRGTNPTSSIVYLLPTTAPTAGQVLSSSAPSVGVSTLSWTTAGGDVTGPASSLDGNFAVFDSTTGKIIKESAGASLTAAGAAVFNTSLALGVGGTTTGQLVFRNNANAFTTTIQASTSATASAIYNWPLAQATSAGQILANDGSGNLSWTAAGAGNVTTSGTGQVITGSIFFLSNLQVRDSGQTRNITLAAPTTGGTGSATITFPVLTGTVALLENTQTFTGAKTFTGGVTVSTSALSVSIAATFSGTAASAASVIINSGANSSLTNPQLSITSSGGANIQWMSFGTGATGNPTLINANRSVGTKIVIYGVTGANLDNALGVDGLSTNGNLWITSPNAIKFFTDNSTADSGRFRYASTVRGLNLNATGTATIPQLLIDGSSFNWINFAQGSVALPTLLSASRSAGTKIVLYSGASGLDNALGVDGVSAGGNLWITSPNAIKFFTNDSTTVRATINTTGLTLGTGSVLTIGANQVVGARDTGYTAFTGTTNKVTAYATGTVTLIQLAERVAALQASLTTHGLIGA
jgi:hypothetical protein